MRDADTNDEGSGKNLLNTKKGGEDRDDSRSPRHSSPKIQSD